MPNRSSRNHASRLAISLGLAAAAFGLGHSANAQQAPANPNAPDTTAPQAPPDETPVSRVVVTGSFIAGTPEDAAIPVQVTTLEDIENLGSPSNMDLIKNFTAVSGIVAGEVNRYNSFPVNYSSVNLRGLGSSRTLVLFNGHRFTEQFSYGGLAGRSTNINQIPGNAVARVETVTDGGSTTYGADAVGGVVNYITRHDFDGLEAAVDYRLIEGSKGDYGASLLWGNNFENGNIMASFEYNVRNKLRARDRDFVDTSLLMNPPGATSFGWSSNGNPGAYTVSTATGTITPTSTGANAYGGNYQMGSTGVVRDPACSALGGFAGWSTTPSPVCYYNLETSFDTMVDYTDSTNVYSEINYDLSNSLRFHLEANWYRAFTDSTLPPSDSNVGGGVPAASTVNGTLNGVPWASANYTTIASTITVPGNNPAVADMLNRMRNADGTLAFTPAQIASVVAGGRMGMSAWRPFLSGGAAYSGEDDTHHRVNSNMFRVSGSLAGEFDPIAGFDIGWETALSYSRMIYRQKTEDIRTDRLVNALHGYGGPECRTKPGVTLLVAGQNGCQWFNPFSSAIAENHYTGAANTATYNPALVNSPELLKWMWQPIWNDRTFDQLSYDLVFHADTPVELPGGPIKVAVGTQYRFNRQDDRLDEFSNRAVTPNSCILPVGANPAGTPQALQGCATNNTAANVGDLWNSRPSTIFGTNTEQTRRYPVLAFFYEANFPILDRWSVATSGRQETFFADLTPTKTTTFVPQIQSKFEITDWMAVRGTASQTFSFVQQPFNDGPTEALSAADVFNLAGTSFGVGGLTSPRFNTANFDNTDIQPEKGTNYNIGVLFNIDHGRLSGSIDYYDITIDDYLRTISLANIVSALVVPGQTGAAAQINCSSGLLSDFNPLFNGRPSVELNGPCVQGVSTLTSASGGLASTTAAQQGRVNFFGGTRQFNGGSYRTSGIDVSATYHLEDILGGDAAISASATRTLKNGLEDFEFQGVKIADGFDGVGYLNYSAARGVMGPVPEWRATLGLNYKRDVHNINLNMRYTSPIRSDITGQFIESAVNNPNVGAANGFVTCGADTNPVYTGDPAGAGTGATGQRVGTTVGYCADQNFTNFLGFSQHPVFNFDLVYRVELPWNSTLALSVFNLLDDEPQFSREKFSYNSSMGNPLGRNFKVEVKQKF